MSPGCSLTGFTAEFPFTSTISFVTFIGVAVIFVETVFESVPDTLQQLSVNVAWFSIGLVAPLPTKTLKETVVSAPAGNALSFELFVLCQVIILVPESKLWLIQE